MVMTINMFYGCVQAHVESSNLKQIIILMKKVCGGLFNHSQIKILKP